MDKKEQIKRLERIVDANINRLKEGLRVCEEITRFLLENPSLSLGFKSLRHRIDILAAKSFARKNLIYSRDSRGDPGRRLNTLPEFTRRNWEDILLANMQRTKESLRVLEEFSKLSAKKTAAGFKEARYQVYELEKKTFKAVRDLLKQ